MQPRQGSVELVFPGPAVGECRVSCPARAKKRRRRVLVVVTICSPRPMRAVQRTRLWAMTWTASQAPFGRLRIGGEAARGEMVEPHAVLQVADGVLNFGVAAMVGLQFQGVALPVGDAAVIAVAGEEGRLATGRGLHPPDDEPHRRGVGLTVEGRVAGLSHVGGAVHPVREGVQSASGMASMIFCQAMVVEGNVDAVRVVIW